MYALKCIHQFEHLKLLARAEARVDGFVKANS